MPPPLPEPPDWLLMYRVIQLAYPGEKFTLSFKPLDSERPLYWRVIQALREEKDAFFHRMRERVQAIKRGEEREALDRTDPPLRDVTDVVIYMLAAELPAEMFEQIQRLYRVVPVEEHGGDTEQAGPGRGDPLQNAI